MAKYPMIEAAVTNRKAQLKRQANTATNTLIKQILEKEIEELENEYKQINNTK